MSCAPNARVAPFRRRLNGGFHIGWSLKLGAIETRPGFEASRVRVGDRNANRRASEVDDALLPDQGH